MNRDLHSESAPVIPPKPDLSATPVEPCPGECHTPLACLPPKMREQILKRLRLALEPPENSAPGRDAATAFQPITSIPPRCPIQWQVSRTRVVRAAFPALPCFQDLVPQPETTATTEPADAESLEDPASQAVDHDLDKPPHDNDAAGDHQQAQLLAQIEALREDDRLKNEFLAMLGHELRNPLSPIRYTVDVLRHSGPLAETLGPMLDILDRQTRQMQRLVDDLLDVGRITRGHLSLQREPLDLLEVARQAVESQQSLFRERAQQLHVDLPEQALIVDGDRARLVQVVSNLLSNAAHYTHPTGRIELSLTRDGPRAVIRVRDNGQGISTELLPRIFELFTRGAAHNEQAHHGLGVGLTVVARLVAMHGGQVRADSPGRGRGSTFTVSLPVLTTAIGATSPNGNETPTEHRRRVLVVDDEPAVTEALGLLLESMGHETRAVQDGAGVVAAVADFSPDLVLLDLEMPAPDGFQVARALRQRYPGGAPKLVALSGYGGEQVRQRVREVGFDWHLLKPADWDSLATLLSDLHWPGL